MDTQISQGGIEDTEQRFQEYTTRKEEYTTK